MTESRECRRCLLIKSGKEDVLADIRKRIEKIPAEEKTTQPEYQDRLAICESCDYLNGGTCLKCGCYPEFRSAFKTNKCPIKKW